MTDLLTPYATRLCLSGVESRRLLDTFKDFGVKHLQVSYYYLRKVFSDPAEFESFAAPFSTVIIDSGTVYHKFKTPEEQESFLGEYAAYLGALNKRAYTAAVSEGGIRLDSFLEDEAIIYPLDDIRPVFDNDLQSLFRNIKYVGVSQKEAAIKQGEELAPIFAHAANEGAWVHLFGTSRKSILNKYPVYSCNTSSWRSGSRYLNTYIYEGPSRGLKLIQPHDKKDTLKTERELKIIRRKQDTMVSVRQRPLYKLIDWQALYEGDAWEVDKGNLSQWIMAAGDYENKAHNKYFLGEEEKALILERQKEVLGKQAESALSRNGEAFIETLDKQGADIRGDNEPVYDPNSPRYTDPDYSPPATGAGSVDNIEETQDIEGDIVDAEVIEEEGESVDIGGRDITPEQDELTANNDPNNAVDSTPAYTSGLPSDLAPEYKRERPIDPRLSVKRKCDFCILAGRCPKYEPGADCAFGLPPENPAYDPTKLEKHVMEDSSELLAIQKDRIMQAYLEEKADGSGLSKDLGKEIERYYTMVQLLAEAQDKRDEVSIKAKGTNLLDIFKK